MKKIALKVICAKIIMVAVFFLVGFIGIVGCRVNRDVSNNLKDTAAATQQAGSGGSSQADAEANKTSEGNTKNSSDESGSNIQTSLGNDTALASESSNENGATSESASNNEGSTTVDENKILYTFVVSGDNRPGNNQDPQPEVFIKLLKYMKQQNPYFYINTGDVIMGNTKNENVIKRQFTDYLDTLKNLDVLNFVAPGNHDVANSVSQKYFLEWIQKAAFNNAALAKIEINSGLPGEGLSGNNSQEEAASEVQIENDFAKNNLYYYFEYNSVYFIILNAYEKGYWGLIEADQLFWLGQLLERLKDKPVFVFLHPPPYSFLNPDCITNGSLHVAFSSKENQDLMRVLFTQFKVDGVFSGHEHLYNSQEHDGVQYIITGGSGSPLYASADKGGFYHFLKIQIKAKSWIMDVIDSSGNKVYAEEILFN